jgi:SAM-dependent methyltransferase
MNLKVLFTELYYESKDSVRRVFGELVPPRKERIQVGGDKNFDAVGKAFLNYFVDLGNLKPHESVLDVGCGVGRMAIPLTRYISRQGEYCGFDISREAIQWCRNNITPRFPNFNFELSDIYNTMYNPAGRWQDTSYIFPYSDKKFDFIFLTSVFTHMLPAGVEHYFSEIARVIKPGGTAMITYFILNEESKALMNQGLAAKDFKHPVESCFTANEAVPEHAIAYNEKAVLDLYEKYRFDLSGPIRYGSWPGRTSHLTFQDLVFATKR